jgi:uncharacterized membrane protein (DUF106 family)
LLVSLLLLFSIVVSTLIFFMWLRDKFSHTNHIVKGIPMAIPINIVGLFGLLASIN